MSMSALGDNVVSDGASVLMFSQIFTQNKTTKNKTTRQSLISESRTGRHPSQIVLRVDHKAQSTLHTCILDSSL